ncbi:MAG: Type secretion system protein precursor [Verrucomicrobiota bacterium]|jgi:prepilin-type N-terminal cleavage/methylation domain-containing protein
MSLRRRFSLIELLMVVAIIAILLSLLLGGMAQARRKAQFVVCFNNAKQIGQSVVLYTNTNRGGIPYSVNAASWDDLLSPHLFTNFGASAIALKGIRVADNIPGGKTWLCPLAPTQAVIDSNAPEGLNLASPSNVYEARSYGINGLGSGQQGRVDGGEGLLCEGSRATIRMSEFTRSASEVILIAERDAKLSCRGWYRSSVTGPMDKYRRAQGLHKESPGKYTNVMTDGSAQFLHWSAMEERQFWK